MSDFKFEEALRSLIHTEDCSAGFKDSFKAGDKLVGTAYYSKEDKDYLIYSCIKCGSTYIVEGKIQYKTSKGL